MTNQTIPQIAMPIHGDVSGVYMIRNVVSGRVYVGSSVRIKRRWAAHRHLLRAGKHHSTMMQRSWRKYGEASFSFEILEVVEDKEKQFLREQYWIDFLHASSPKIGLNGHPRAGGPRGHKLSLDVRLKMSVSRKGRKLNVSRKGWKVRPRTEEHKAAISAAKRGTKASPETRVKQSATRKGKKLGPQSNSHKAAISKARTGIKISDEARAAMSVRLKGKPLPPGMTQLGVKQSPERIIKASKARSEAIRKKNIPACQMSLF